MRAQTTMIGGDHCLAPARTVDAPIDGASGRYSRLFPDLPPLMGENEALLSLGAAGGVCDGGDACPAAVETAAGWPMFGQYIAHDITADRSPISARGEQAQVVNFRSPRADLESLYGSGQIGSPYLFRADDPDLLLLGMNDRGEPDDLPRNSQGIALIGDPRNDVHLFVSQLQVAMIRVHNRLVEQARRGGVPATEVFAAARRGTVWHYQWVILNDYLPRLVSPGLAEEVLEQGPRFYRPGDDPRIPFEFADAAFRYGHGQVRDDFRLNAESGVRRLFPDLLGFRPVPAELAIDWTLLFDVEGHSPAQRAKRIDGSLVRSLIALPTAVTGEVEVDAYRSLAGRDLERSRLRTAVGRGRRPGDGGEPVERGGERFRRPRLDRGHASVALLHVGVGRPRRRRAPRPDRRPDRRRGADRADRRRPGVLPLDRARLDPNPAFAGRLLRARRPARPRRGRIGAATRTASCSASPSRSRGRSSRCRRWG
jgi:hypothetical protein